MKSFIKKHLVVLEKISRGRVDAQVLKVKVKNMLNKYQKINKVILAVVDLILLPLTFISALVLKMIRVLGISNMRFSKRLFEFIGIYPILDHYYEPLFNKKHLRKTLDDIRHLPGVVINDEEQLELLSKLNYQEELLQFPIRKRSTVEFAFDGGSFPRGDSEYYYSIIRYFKPRKIIEIGSGQSTLMAINAINQNKKDDPNYINELFCVEPFEQAWLEKLNVKVIRKKVEEFDPGFFLTLEPNDILFIDSSHIIKPHGDILFLYLEVLPSLKPGVLIHVHDIFTPRDYPGVWLIEENLFWNEQYLLEAFLTNNRDFKVIGALNYLGNKYPGIFLEKNPVLDKKLGNKPVGRKVGSFWFMKK
jgi:hypothetical protein